MASSFTWRRRVEFADTDAAGVAHFTALFRFVEEAEHAFYRSLGGAAFEWRDQALVGMPRVHASLDFLAAARYGDELDVRLRVVGRRERSLHYETELSRGEGDERTVVARGSMTVVYATRPHGERDWRAAPLPPELADAIEPEDPED